MEITETRHLEVVDTLEAIRDKETPPVVIPAPVVNVAAAAIPAPVVNLEPVVIPAPIVNLAGPVVNIPESPPAPEFPPHPPPVSYRYTVERDLRGKITGGQIFPEG